jgi:hypothetical protein
LECRLAAETFDEDKKANVSQEAKASWGAPLSNSAASNSFGLASERLATFELKPTSLNAFLGASAVDTAMR